MNNLIEKFKVEKITFPDGRTRSLFCDRGVVYCIETGKSFELSKSPFKDFQSFIRYTKFEASIGTYNKTIKCEEEDF